jgi:hypothetical protein
MPHRRDADCGEQEQAKDVDAVRGHLDSPGSEFAGLDCSLAAFSNGSLTVTPPYQNTVASEYSLRDPLPDQA